MASSSLVDDLKDSLVDALAPEYHRLNPPGDRYHLPGIESFLAVVVVTFLVPFLKKLAENAADKTWSTFFGSNRGQIPDEDLNRSASQLLDVSEAAAVSEAGREGVSEVEQLLHDQNFPVPVQIRVKEIIMREITILHERCQKKK